MAEFDLNDVLEECKKSASTGYKIATGQHKTLKKTLSHAQEEIKNTLMDFQTSSCYVSGATEMLSKQLIDIESSFDNSIKSCLLILSFSSIMSLFTGVGIYVLANS